MYPPFIAEQSGLHIQQVVSRRFLIAFNVPFQLELLRFQDAAIIDVAEIESMSDEELCEKAEELGVDLRQFIVE